MATYAFRDLGGDLTLSAPEFGKPVPAHAQGEGAARAVDAVRAAGAAKRRNLADADIVAAHGTPAFIPYEVPEVVVKVTKKGKRKRIVTGRMLPGEAVPAAARRFAALAEAHGMRVNVIELADRCTVEAIEPRLGVACRAYWKRGRADGGTWHERSYRYTLVSDARPVGVNKVSRTGLAKHRPAGVGTTRLSILASPLGVPCNITELAKRIEQL